jgi:AcrR family transcriptional regulator
MKMPAKERILATAERLFAERGIDAVGIREITTAAGLKNAQSVTYYFKTKDNLVREVLLAGARAAEARRQYWLDRLESAGRAISIRDVIRIMLAPRMEQAVTPSYGRLTAQIMMTQEDWLREVIGTDLLKSVDRCNSHLRKLTPHLSREIANERIMLFHIYFSAFLATRDIRIESGEDQGRWASRHVIEQLIDTCEALFLAKPSRMTERTWRSFARRKQAFDGILPSDGVAMDLFDEPAG